VYPNKPHAANVYRTFIGQTFNRLPYLPGDLPSFPLCDSVIDSPGGMEFRARRARHARFADASGERGAEPVPREPKPGMLVLPLDDESI
jgi:hypothetical protein